MEEKEMAEIEAGTGQPDNYDKRYAAYKKELSEAIKSVPPGASMGFLIAELRKKHGLYVYQGDSGVDQSLPQGNWSLKDLEEQRTKRMAQEEQEKIQRQKKAEEAQQLKGLRSRLHRAQFYMPRGFSWPEDGKEILRPFELALDRQIWACFSLLKVLLREALAQEFNLPGVEVDLLKFAQDASIYPGGEKQLLTDALSALKALLRIMLTKPEPEKVASKVEKPAARVQPKSKISVPLAAEKKGVQPVRSKPAEAAKVPAKFAPAAAKSEFRGFLWNNKFRRMLNLKPQALNDELEKAFIQLSPLHQRAIVFRFRIAQPAVSLRELMAGVMKRGVEELVKKAAEELRQKVLALRREEGIFIKSSASAEPEPKLLQPEPVLPEEKKQAEAKPLLGEVTAESNVAEPEVLFLPLTVPETLLFLPAQSEETREPEAFFPEEVNVKTESAPMPEPKPAPLVPVEKKHRARVSRLKQVSLPSDSSGTMVAREPMFRLPENFEVNFVALASAMWKSKNRDKAWQDLRQDRALLESRRALAEVLPQLNKEQARILFLRYVKGLSWKQIGPIMNLGKWQYAYGYFFRAIEMIATLLRRLKNDFPRRAARFRVSAKPKPVKAARQSKKTPYAEKRFFKKENEKEAAQALSQTSLAKIKKLLWPEGRFLESSEQLIPFFVRPWRRGKVKSVLEEEVFFLLVGEEHLGEKEIAQRLGRERRAVYCAKSLFLRKLRDFCANLRKKQGLGDEPPDEISQEAWIEKVLKDDFTDVSKVEALLREISEDKFREAIGPDSSVFKRAEQLVPLFLQPGKFGVSLTVAQAKIFLLSFWQERIMAHKIAAKGGPSTRMVHSLRHSAAKKIRVLAQKIAESGISVEEFLKKALVPPAPKMVICRRRIKTSKVKKVKPEISLVQLGNYLVLLGLRFLALSPESDEVPEVKLQEPEVSKEFIYLWPDTLLKDSGVPDLLRRYLGNLVEKLPREKKWMIKLRYPRNNKRRWTLEEISSFGGIALAEIINAVETVFKDLRVLAEEVLRNPVAAPVATKAFFSKPSLKGPSHAARLLRSAAFCQDLGIDVSPAVITEHLAALAKERRQALIARYCGNGGGACLSWAEISRRTGWGAATLKQWVGGIITDLRQKAGEVNK